MDDLEPLRRQKSEKWTAGIGLQLDTEAPGEQAGCSEEGQPSKTISVAPASREEGKRPDIPQSEVKERGQGDRELEKEYGKEVKISHLISEINHFWMISDLNQTGSR